MTRFVSSLAIGLAVATSLPALALAQPYGGDVYGGVRLTERERQDIVRRVRAPDGTIVEVTESYGLPFLFGAGDVRGAPSSQPVVNGITNSVRGSTPSGGLVPGQEPE